jgi:peptide/nickel transport system permease protein
LKIFLLLDSKRGVIVMGAYVVRRILTMVPILIVLSILVFISIELTPGNVASFLIDPDLPFREYEAIKEAMGLNKSVLVRYLAWSKEILKGNLGYSMIDGSPISGTLSRKVPATIELMLAAFIISTLLGTALGMLSALRQYSFIDHILTIIGMIGLSVPQFFVGLLGIYIFGLRLCILPVGGRLSIDRIGFISRLPNLVMPALVLGLALTAGLMRYSRSAMLSVLNKDYIKTARSKGLTEWRINFVHGFRNALIPIIVLLVFRLPMFFGGSVIVERVFSWPGMGSMFLQGIQSRDYNVIMVTTLLMATAVLIASLLLDVFTALLDPRVRYE